MTSKFDKIYNSHLETLNERIVVDYYRDQSGKLKKKQRTTRPGYRIKYIKGKPKEVKMSAQERKNRKTAAKKAAIRRYRKSNSSKKSIKKSIRIG